jgi:MFS transporter, DHA3 family, multidrug efflux protein
MPRAFHLILGNTLVASLTNFTVWFAVTFWVYLETHSVFATGVLAGIYLVFTAGFGFWFGSLVDHHPKKTVMLGSSVASFTLYAVALILIRLAPWGSFNHVSSPWLWALVLSAMLGVIAGNIRMIALTTLVTMLIPEDSRDKANGLVGMVTGIGFLMTSVISGFLVAFGGMAGALALALVLTLLAFLHLASVPIGEVRSDATPDTPAESKKGRHQRHDPGDR